MHLVWFFKVSGHLCQQLIGGNADIDGKAQLVIDPLSHLLRSDSGGSPKPLRAGHIHPRLIDGILLHHRRKLPQHIHEVPAGLHIQSIVRLHHLQLRALFQRLKQWLAGLDTVLLGRAGFRQDDAVAGFLIPCHHRRHIPQILCFSQDFDLIGSGPAQKRRVGIHMKDHFLCHQ